MARLARVVGVDVPHHVTQRANARQFILGSDAGKIGPLRIKKVASGTTTVYIYSGSRAVAEYVNGQLGSEYIYSGSQRVATIAGAAITYHHSDLLSKRADSNAAGTVTRTFGHFPYGETWYEAGTTDKWKFTTYERDVSAAETGLDYAQFRDYASGMGRFMTADLRSGVITAPQSLHRYSYALNDPVNNTDPFGLDADCQEDDFTACVTATPPSIDVCGPDPFADCELGGPPDLSFLPPAPLPNLFPDPPIVPRFAPSAKCLQKILDAINKALGISATFLGPTNMKGASGDTDPNKPGWRNGAWNFDFFGPDMTAPNWFEGRDPNSGLHLPPAGGVDPVTPLYGPGTYNGQPGFFFTAHFDSSNPTSDAAGLFKHVIGDVLLKLPHGC